MSGLKRYRSRASYENGFAHARASASLGASSAEGSSRGRGTGSSSGRSAGEPATVGALFVDFDRAESAFALLFSFVRDDRADEPPGFDAVLLDMLRGVSLPPAARAKLKRIFDSVSSSPRSLPEMANDVVRDFTGEPEILVALVRLLLRLAADEGMLSRRHIADLKLVLGRFHLPPVAFESCDDEELQLLSYVFGDEWQSGFGNHARELERHYATLGCDSDASDAELRRAYRELAKRYHPDARARQAGDDHTHRFREVQRAYDMIRKNRGSGAS